MVFQCKSKVYISGQTFHCSLILMLQSVDSGLNKDEYKFADKHLS